MNNINDIPEKARQRIKEMFDELAQGMEGKYKDVVLHMITQIAYEMYNKGWQDAHRLMYKAIEINEKTFLGGV